MVRLLIIVSMFLIHTSSLHAGNDWTQKSPSSKPSARAEHDMAYIGGDQVLLFGGNDGSYNGETWVYDLSDNTWTQKSTTWTPSVRKNHAMAYIGGDQALFFGGLSNGYRQSDTWVYDFSANSWIWKGPSTSPSARSGHAMAYIGGDQVLLFGGWDSDTYDGETWVYDLSANTWTQKSPSTAPSARYEHDMAYIGGDQVLLFGGQDGNYSRSQETWVYDLSANTWTKKSPSTSPSARSGHAMAYIGGDRVMLFGGYDNADRNDTWIYDLSANTWTQDSNTSQPSARTSHRLSETSMNGTSYLVLFGGWTTAGKFDETWTFGGGDYSLPVELSSFSARVKQNGSVLLEWITESEIENLGFVLERQTEGAPEGWEEIASYITDPELQGQGSVTYRTEYSYTDNTVEIGKSYDYRLADVSYIGVKEYHTIHVLGITVTKTIPDKFILYPAYPNPFNPVTKIDFDLPEASHVTLVVYDVTGREVATLVDGLEQEGRSSVVWDGKDGNGLKVSSGIYFVLMKANEKTTSQKIILLR